jgi:hypothetical protein
MVLQPVHELIPRGRVRGGFASPNAGRPAFLRWLPDSLFHYYLSTAQRPPFIRSWNVASFTERIFCCVRSSIDGRGALPVSRPRSSSPPPQGVAQAPTTCTNQSPKPCSGACHNWLLLSIRVVVSAPCHVSGLCVNTTMRNCLLSNS